LTEHGEFNAKTAGLLNTTYYIEVFIHTYSSECVLYL